MNWVFGLNIIKFQFIKDLVDILVGLFKYQFDVDFNELFDQNMDIVDIIFCFCIQIYYGYVFLVIFELGGLLYVDLDECFNIDRNNDCKGVRFNYKFRLIRSLNFNIDYEFECKLYVSNIFDSCLIYINFYIILLDKMFSCYFQLIG